MESIITWVQTTAFPALSICFEFLRNSISDIINVMFGSRLVFFFSLFLIGTVIATLVAIFMKAPDVTADSFYPHYGFIKPRELYYTGFYRPFKFLNSLLKFFDAKEKKAELEARKKAAQEARDKERADAQALADEYFENNQTRMTVSYNGFKFYAPDWYKRNWGNTHKIRTTKYRDKYGNLQIRTSDTETKDVSNEFEQIED